MTAEFVAKITPMLFAPVSMQQYVTAKDSPAKGTMWVSRTTFNEPEDQYELKSIVMKAIKDLAPVQEPIRDFPIEDVKAQWTSFRPSGQEKDLEPSLSEQEKYLGMLKDITTDTVVLFAHGGFYYTGSPASVRRITLAIAKETGGRCIVPEYRLAPQNPFPAAIVDLFLAYLTLLYPSDDSMHTVISAKDIVLAGDSSGWNLVLSLLALLQHIRDSNNGQVHFQGKLVHVPLPAGIATLSPHCDHTMSL
ncbi:Nn.00g112820.m01.CDS01 [Neocucurbitaria sp. VM-36]